MDAPMKNYNPGSNVRPIVGTRNEWQTNLFVFYAPYRDPRLPKFLPMALIPMPITGRFCRDRRAPCQPYLLSDNCFTLAKFKACLNKLPIKSCNERPRLQNRPPLRMLLEFVEIFRQCVSQQCASRKNVRPLGVLIVVSCTCRWNDSKFSIEIFQDCHAL